MVDSNDPDLISKLQGQFKLLREERNLIKEKIDPWLEKVDSKLFSENERKQKRKELIDLGNFLHYLDKDIRIKEAFTESPDFIIKSKENLIGVELKDLVIDISEKEKEGLLKSIFKEVIKSLETDLNKYKGSYRIEFIEENFSLKRNNRELIKNEIISNIKGLNNKPVVVKKVTKFPYEGIALHKGETTIVGNLSKVLVQKRINSKEKLIPLYYQKDISQIWLVMVIGGVEKSSDFSLFDPEITEDEFASNFDRIFIYEFFDRKITELKITSHNNI